MKVENIFISAVLEMLFNPSITKKLVNIDLNQLLDYKKDI